MSTASYEQRLATSRLVHRFNFGPKPGQFVELLERGLGATQASVLEHDRADPGLDAVGTLHLADLGQIPNNEAASAAFWKEIYANQTTLVSWWLDRMYAADYPLGERMTWFWHGHWATAISKVMYPLAMLKQNDTLRKNALGNFKDMAREMVTDGALNYWLDNEENYVTSPNENLARELMELMTLGVNKFTEDDVKAAARALTGYYTNLPTGAVGFNATQHYDKPVTILGTTAKLDAESLVALIVSKQENAKFISDRLWFRFVSGTTKPPPSLEASFGESRYLLPRECAGLLVRVDQSRELPRKSPRRVVHRSVPGTQRPPFTDERRWHSVGTVPDGPSPFQSAQRRRLAVRPSVVERELLPISIPTGLEHRAGRRSGAAQGSQIENGPSVRRLARRGRVVATHRQHAGVGNRHAL